jgi:hypothetical protein
MGKANLETKRAKHATADELAYEPRLVARDRSPTLNGARFVPHDERHSRVTYFTERDNSALGVWASLL